MWYKSLRRPFHIREPTMVMTIEVTNFSAAMPHLTVEVIFPDRGDPHITDRTGYTRDDFYDRIAIEAATKRYRQLQPPTVRQIRNRRA